MAEWKHSISLAAEISDEVHFGSTVNDQQETSGSGTSALAIRLIPSGWMQSGVPEPTVTAHVICSGLGIDRVVSSDELWVQVPNAENVQYMNVLAHDDEIQVDIAQTTP